MNEIPQTKGTKMKIVKYSKPNKGEEDMRFILLEDRGDRVLIQYICDWTIKPTECVLKSEIFEL